MIAERIGAMALLVVLSAFFSGSETALFSLGEVRRGRLAKSRRVLDRAAAGLLGRPGALLTTILMANLAVNVAYFSLAATTLPLLEDGRARLLGGLGFLVAIVIGGEIVPKAVALAVPLPVARAAAVPLWAVYRTLAPLRIVLMALIRLALGRLSHDDRSARLLSPAEIRRFLAGQPGHFDLTEETSARLSEVLELAEIRVREAMLPRVDVPFFDLGRGLAALRERFREGRLAWVVACRGESPDQALGRIDARSAFLEDEAGGLEARVERLAIVPEVARLEAALEVLRRERSGQALVVDEYGGVAGVLTLERLLAEVFGPLEEEGETPRVSLRERGVWQVSGGLSVREWCERFAPEAEPPAAVESMGGLFTALVGHIPRHGEEALFEGWRLRVLRLRRRRVEALEMRRERPVEEES